MTRPLPMPSTSAAMFWKVRRDHAAETAQDYVEAVADILYRQGECRVKDLARHMGVSHVTVTRTVARLQEEELVETEPYRPIRLTPAGQRMAAASRQRHELVVRFLTAIGVPQADAQRDAEGIEHHVGETTLQAMREFLDRHPDVMAQNSDRRSNE